MQRSWFIFVGMVFVTSTLLLTTSRAGAVSPDGDTASLPISGSNCSPTATVRRLSDRSVEALVSIDGRADDSCRAGRVEVYYATSSSTAYATSWLQPWTTTEERLARPWVTVSRTEPIAPREVSFRILANNVCQMWVYHYQLDYWTSGAQGNVSAQLDTCPGSRQANKNSPTKFDVSRYTKTSTATCYFFATSNYNYLSTDFVTVLKKPGSALCPGISARVGNKYIDSAGVARVSWTAWTPLDSVGSLRKELWSGRPHTAYFQVKTGSRSCTTWYYTRGTNSWSSSAC